MGDTRIPQEVYDSEPNPRVSLAVFLRRISMGWDHHRALHTSLDGRFVKPVPVISREPALYEVLGRKQTLEQWSTVSGVSVSRLQHGIKVYGSLQSYFLNIGWYPSKPRYPEPDPE